MNLIRALVCNCTQQPLRVQLPIAGSSTLHVSLNSYSTQQYTLWVGAWIKVNGQNTHCVSKQDAGGTITLG